MNFVERYGPWGIVAGASEGLGAEYARELAARGLNVVLVARRLDLLESLAAGLHSEYGVRTKCLELDLSQLNAAEQIVWQTMDLDVGLLVFNAAASTVGPFLEGSMDAHLRELQTNIYSPYKLVYLLSQHLVERGRGGILLMASLSAYQGSPYIATYAATKAFNIILAEGLWDELRSCGVDVLVCAAGAMDTPKFAASRPAKTGGPGDRRMDPARVARAALDALGGQPYIIPGRMNRISSFVMRHLLPRRTAIRLMGRTLRKMYVKTE